MKSLAFRQVMITTQASGGKKGAGFRQGNRSRSVWIKILGYAGTALFIYLIIKTGPREIWNTLRRMSAFELLALFGLRFLFLFTRTVNWQALFIAAKERVSLLEVFGARIAAYAVSYLTPAGNIGGEAARIFMIGRGDRKKILATVVIDKTIEFLAGTFTVAIAVLFLITEVALPRRQKLTLFAAVAGIFLLLVYLVLKQKKGFFSWILESLRRIRLRIPFLENRQEQILETDAHIADFYNKRKGLFFLLFSSYTFQAWLWALEIYLTFVFLRGALTTYLNCYLIVTLGSFYSFIPIPGSMGVYELTYVSIFALLRIEMAAGMAVILVRRILGLAWAGLGLIPFLKRKHGDRGLARPSPQAGPSPT